MMATPQSGTDVSLPSATPRSLNSRIRRQPHHRSLSDYNSNLSSPISASLSDNSSCACSNHPSSIPSTIQSPPPPSNSPPRPLLQSARSGNSLNVLQWNANGIRSKHKELLDFLVRNKVHVALIQESKLRANTLTPTFSGYSTLRL